MWPRVNQPDVRNFFSVTARHNTVCRNFLQNQCPHSASTCPYSHDKDDAPLCQGWKKGICHGHAWQCFERHYYLERDQAPASRMPLQQVSGNTAFSSPLVVKNKTFTETHRKEEVDLETGRRRSWIETENKELIDITGEASPVAPPRKEVSFSSKMKEKVAEEELQKKKELEMREARKKIDGKSSSECEVCGKKFKGVKGVKSHLTHPQSKCGKSVTLRGGATLSIAEDGAAASSAGQNRAPAASVDLERSVYVISDDEDMFE